jgi:hypothetical protein
MKTRKHFNPRVAGSKLLKCITALFAVIAILALSMTGCEGDDPDPILCNCPNGTLHLVGETCCEGTNCTCEKNVIGQRVQGIPVTSRGGDHTKAITNVTTAFGTTYLSASEVGIIKNNVREIQVKSSGTTATFEKKNGKYTVIIPENANGAVIADRFYDILDDI